MNESVFSSDLSIPGPFSTNPCHGCLIASEMTDYSRKPTHQQDCDMGDDLANCSISISHYVKTTDTDYLTLSGKRDITLKTMVKSYIPYINMEWGKRMKPILLHSHLLKLY